MNWGKLLTDADGDANIAEILAIVGGVLGIGLTVAKYIKSGEFNYEMFAAGTAGIIASLGAAQRLRGDNKVMGRDQ
jgi:hypothetical protein